MMLRLCLLGLLAVCFVNGDYFDNKVADTDYLLKQKKVYNLLYHATQPSVVNLPLYKEGQAYNIDANIDSYSNPAAVKDFLYMYEQGMLPRGEVFSFFYPKLFKECQALFKLFYYAKDFETFYKTALWARIYINENQFIISLYNAVIRRPDTLYIQLPPPYELFPNLFFNAEVLEKAHHVKSFGKMDTEKSEGYETYVIPANYSGWYLNREYDLENKLNYFTEDIGLNAYYFFFRLDSPLWMTKEEYNLPSYRGGEYLYGHKQLLNRYYLERLSNDLPKIEDFDWQKPFFAGYYPTMTFANGLPFPQRQQWSNFPFFKNSYIKDIHDMEMRVSAAIDSGFALDATGKWINIYTPEGLNLLGNMIEGNGDSCNREFYGSIDIFGRKILGFNLEPANSYQILPSALEFFSTSMRDPAFYRFYKRIINYYYKYQAHQKQYNKNEIVYPSLKIESFVIDKLITYFDQFDASISNGLMVEDQKQADSQLVKVRQYRLNHKPFSFHFTINSEKQTKAAIRIFLGPKYDAHHRLIECPENFKYFYEIDNYMVNLNAGLNKISRKSEDFFFVINDQESSEIYYEKVLKALDGSKPLSYYQRLTGFPERLILPKGKKEGMPFQLFAYVSPVNAEMEYSSRIFGNYKMDTKPFGFPLDRLIYNYKYDGPNMISKDIFIFHKDEMDLNIAY